MDNISILAETISKVIHNSTQSGSSVYTGYVVGVYLDEEDERYGTIDVQENTIDTTGDPESGQGLHTGVQLTAIQDISNGKLFIPKMYSDVVVIRDNSSNEEYVVHSSQLDVVKLEGGSTVSVGVIERDEFDPEGDIDVEDVPETGNKSWTEYTCKKVVTTIQNDSGDKTVIEATPDNATVSVCDKATITINKDGSISIKGNDIKVEGSNVTITGGKLSTKGVANTDMQGPFCAIPTCPFSGAPHTGSMVSGT